MTRSAPESTRSGIPHPFPPYLSVDVIASHIVAKNPQLSLTASEVKTIAEECVGRSLNVSATADGSDCESLPIFVTGEDVPHVTLHQLSALDDSGRPTQAAWIKLNYESASTKPGNRNWYNDPANFPDGEDPCANILDGEDCDEFPMWSTEQGGALGSPLPSVQPVPHDDNNVHGINYSSFLRNCGLQSAVRDTGGSVVEHGGAFVNLPVDPELHIPSVTTLCNDGS